MLLNRIFVSVDNVFQGASNIHAEAAPVVLKPHSVMRRCSMNAKSETTVRHHGRPDRISALANDAELSSVLALPIFMQQLCHAASYSDWATSAIGRLPTVRFAHREYRNFEESGR
jgi:hypothetical protein